MSLANVLETEEKDKGISDEARREAREKQYIEEREVMHYERT